MRVTPIQWTHSTINPVMGCNGCELWPAQSRLLQLVTEAILAFANPPPAEAVRAAVSLAGASYPLSSQLYSARRTFAEDLATRLHLGSDMRDHVMDVIRGHCACYAGLLGAMRAGHPGYADRFEQPKVFPGRVAAAARWALPSAAERAAKPWLQGAPRMIFISDMGDALSGDISFETLKTEIVDPVRSPDGSRHLWLWLTKRPGPMAQFGRWLLDLGFVWPDNLVAMTTVTSQATAARAAELTKVPSRFKGLSCEPLHSEVDLDLTGIDWVIAGGGSDILAKPFHIEWAIRMKDECRRDGVAFFLKQLGRHPFYQGKPIEGMGVHGGDWNLWPEQDWKVREIPAAFRQMPFRN
jgi:protein gp37